MYICVCQAISEKKLEQLAREENGNYTTLQLKHGVGATCGHCEGCAKEVCKKVRSSAKTVCA